MPIQRQVSDLTDASDSDSFEAAPKGQRAASSGQKRKQLTPAERSSEGHLRSVLGRECSCKRKTCFQQFIFEPAFSELSNYRCHWYELHKLDQDQFAPRPELLSGPRARARLLNPPNLISKRRARARCLCVCQAQGLPIVALQIFEVFVLKQHLES